MKVLNNSIKKLGLLLTGIIVSMLTFAQEKGVDVDLKVTESSNTWYTQPWMWVVGGAVFVLILVALLKGGKKSN